MSQYLEEAAAQLRKVATDIDKAEARYHSSYRDQRHKLAEAFGALAAIEKESYRMSQDELKAIRKEHPELWRKKGR
jgi:septation ring formation regulator EzrA